MTDTQRTQRGQKTQRGRPVRTGFFLCVLCVLCVGIVVAPARAQIRRPKAEVTPLVEKPQSRGGYPVRVALKVSLPEGLHTQSDTPRDPNLIPTVLTIDAPAGVTIEELVFPPSTDLKQAGQDQPLAVFEREFLIGVQLKLAAAVPVGTMTIPAHLRYQACDANLCYPPWTADTQWSFDILGSSALEGDAGNPDGAAFAKIAFGHGKKPGVSPDATPRTGSGAAAGGGDGVAKLDDFAVLGTTGGYQGSGEFLKFISDAENGVKQTGPFEGRGPLAILLIVLIGGLALNLTPCVLPMIPINLAIIGAGTQAGSRIRATRRIPLTSRCSGVIERIAMAGVPGTG